MSKNYMGSIILNFESVVEAPFKQSELQYLTFEDDNVTIVIDDGEDIIM